MDIKGLFGNPYVGWSPRPLKNGQPPPCYSQCNLNIGARKVGAALRRYPQIFMSPKSKDQILQKWDPLSKRLVNIHQREIIIPPVAPERTHITIEDINISYPSALRDGVFFTYRLLSDKNDIVNVALYRSNGTFIGSADPQNIVAGSTEFIDGVDTNYTDALIGISLYIVVTPTNGDPVVSGQLVVERTPTVITLYEVSLVYSASGDSSFIYTYEINAGNPITITIYNNGTEPDNVNGTNTGITTTLYTDAYTIRTESIFFGVGAITVGNYYYLRIQPENGPAVVSALFQAL